MTEKKGGRIMWLSRLMVWVGEPDLGPDLTRSQRDNQWLWALVSLLPLLLSSTLRIPVYSQSSRYILHISFLYVYNIDIYMSIVYILQVPRKRKLIRPILGLFIQSRLCSPLPSIKTQYNTSIGPDHLF